MKHTIYLKKVFVNHIWKLECLRLDIRKLWLIISIWLYSTNCNYAWCHVFCVGEILIEPNFSDFSRKLWQNRAQWSDITTKDLHAFLVVLHVLAFREFKHLDVLQVIFIETETINRSWLLKFPPFGNYLCHFVMPYFLCQLPFW